MRSQSLRLGFCGTPIKQEQRDQLDRLVRTLDHPGASMRVARLALEMIGSIA